jgi:hypothetical protein
MVLRGNEMGSVLQDHRHIFLVQGLAKVVLLKVIHSHGLGDVLLLLLHVRILSGRLIEHIFINLLLLTCLMVRWMWLLLLMDLRNLLLRVLLPSS